jgi:hypothetical protein
MPSISVGLDVRNWASSGSDGYTSTTATNNAVYSYKYSGGSDGNGNVNDTVGSGALTINVGLASDSRYTIHGVNIVDDVENQLTQSPGANSTSWVVMDADSQTGSAYYQVVVSDNSANCTFLCDPRVTNVPT